MRCLLTGFTNKQRGESDLNLILLIECMKRALKHHGWHVEHRSITEDEDLKAQFDIAVVGIFNYAADVCGAQKFVASRAALELPHVLAWDDWNAESIWGSVRKGTPAFMRLGLQENSEKAQGIKERLTARYDYGTLAKRWSQNVHACVCCAFNWGEHARLKAKHNFDHFLAWDPSPWAYGSYAPDYSQPRQKMWVAASLGVQHDWLESLDLTWPIIDVTKPKPGARNWQLQEGDLFKLYCTNRGVLSNPYPTMARTGWWRNRFPFASETGCIVAAHPSEVASMGETTHYFWSTKQIEAMDDDSLDAIAAAQAEELRSWELSLEQSGQQLAEWLERSAGR
jgi:hypothetical protein